MHTAAELASESLKMWAFWLYTIMATPVAPAMCSWLCPWIYVLQQTWMTSSGSDHILYFGVETRDREAAGNFTATHTAVSFTALRLDNATTLAGKGFSVYTKATAKTKPKCAIFVLLNLKVLNKRISSWQAFRVSQSNEQHSSFLINLIENKWPY